MVIKEKKIMLHCMRKVHKTEFKGAFYNIYNMNIVLCCRGYSYLLKQ